MRKLFGILIVVSLLGLGAPVAQARPLSIANPVLTVAAEPWPLVINQGARITLTASNPTGENADNVIVTAAVPNNMSLENVTPTQGGVNVFNMAVTNYVGTLAPGQTVMVYLDVVVVEAYPSDAPFNLCGGLTFANGTARLSCLPNQAAVSSSYRPVSTLPPNGHRPIDDPNRPPVYLPVTGANPIDLFGPIVFWSGLALGALGLARRRTH